MIPFLNERKCPAQEQVCKFIPACPEGAVAYIVDEKAPLGGRIVIDLEKCNGCGICAAECCGSAIELR